VNFIFQKNQKLRFFLFRHLPANLIASFAKRLARLALLIPQHDQCLILTFISNLIIRHPTIRIMIDGQSTTDNYSSEEVDPNKTNAIESSLWEIEVKLFNIFY
jgi:U3 small nucleolar RNA-associated protein 19